MNRELLNQILKVSEARYKLQAANILRVEAYKLWQEANQHLFDEENQARELCDEAENALREMTIKIYKETGEKKPAPGVGIREVTKLEYETEKALVWAIKHQVALQLDKKAFEDISKSIKLDFVKIITETQATIATDLSKVLAEVTNEWHTL